MAKASTVIGPVELGNTRLKVDCNEYTFEKVQSLLEAVSDIRRRHSIFAKYPMDEEETREKWRERVEPLIEKDLTRKEGEALQDHLKRVFETKSDTHDMAYEIIKAICETFALREVNEDDFKKANWIELKTFIFNVLNSGDIPADDFAPKILL